MTISLSLTGQSALVTGGGAGIGRAIAVRLALAGADVAVTDIIADAAHEACEPFLSRSRPALATY